MMANRRLLSRCQHLVSRLSQNVRSSRLYSTAPSLAGFDDYDSTKKNFTLSAPDYYNFATDVIDRWALEEAHIKKTPAFWWFDDKKHTIQWSFSDLSDKSKRCANILSGACGLKPGDRIMVILPRIPEWWLINIACIRAGLVLIPGTTQLTGHDILQRLQKSGCKAIIVDNSHMDSVDEIQKECPALKIKLVVTSSSTRKDWLNWREVYNLAEPEYKGPLTKSSDPMTIFFTSGTTGAPKMTEHTHASFGLAHLISGRFWLDLTPNDIMWNLSDTGWAKAAYSNLFAPWLLGSCVFIHHSLHKFDPEECLKILSEHPVDVFCSPPTAYRMMVQQNLSKYNGLGDVRHYVSGGEALNPEVTTFWEDKTGKTIRQGYGQTETVIACGTYRCIPNRPGSMGKPAPGMPLMIVDDNGKECADGVEGDIVLKLKPDRPLGLFTKYVDEPERTAKAFVGDFYVTGDRAYRDEQGYIWFVSRDDDIITSAGYRIGPFEVESALIEHPAVAESAVVSSPDVIRGEVVKAFVVLTSGYQDWDSEALVKELQTHVKHVTAPYKYPRKIEFVADLPKTISGKIRRVELREKEWNKNS